jgi:hypothetical protein
VPTPCAIRPRRPITYLKMALTLHTTPAEHLELLLDKAVSPLDQALGTIACADPERTPIRTRAVMRMRTRLAAGEYVVDAEAAADAIVERLRPAGPMTWLQAQAAV